MSDKFMPFEDALDEVLAMSDEEILALPSDPVLEDVFATISSMEEALTKACEERRSTHFRDLTFHQTKQYLQRACDSLRLSSTNYLTPIPISSLHGEFRNTIPALASWNDIFDGRNGGLIGTNFVAEFAEIHIQHAQNHNITVDEHDLTFFCSAREGDFPWKNVA